MKEVTCFYCEFFSPKFNSTYFKSVVTGGFCMHKGAVCETEARVCENFKIRSGLFTRRRIPKYCEKYSLHNSKHIITR